MHTNIFHKSKNGNGLEVANFIKESIEKDSDIIHMKNLEEQPLKDADCSIFICPTYMGSANWGLKKVLKKIQNHKNGDIYVILTGSEKKFNIDAINKIFGKFNMKLVKNPIKVLIKGTKGPIESDYKTQVEDFLKK